MFEISFRDLNREKQRVGNLGKKKTLSKRSLVKKEKKDRYKQIQLERSRKKEKKIKKKRPDNEDSDWEELAKDALLVKRLKKGKMSEKDFERAMGLSSDDEY